MENAILTLEQHMAPGPAQHEFHMKLESEPDMKLYFRQKPDLCVSEEDPSISIWCSNFFA